MAKKVILAEPTEIVVRPKAVVAGTLFDGLVDCHVLKDERRVVSQRGILRLLRGSSSGDKDSHLARLVARLPKRFAHLAVGPIVEFDMLERGEAHGFEATRVVDILDAYAEAFTLGELRKDQEHLGRNAIIALRAIAKIGIIAMIDEATGYQQVRGDRALERLHAKILLEEAAKWELTFQPSLVRALAPLYGTKYLAGPYPKALHKPFAMIYDMILGKDASGELRGSRGHESPPIPHGSGSARPAKRTRDRRGDGGAIQDASGVLESNEGALPGRGVAVRTARRGKGGLRASGQRLAWLGARGP